MATDRVIAVRLSPSGPEIGTPSSVVGISAQAGREWGKSGVGAITNVPGASAGDALGLESVPVDLRPASSGYQYDVFLSTNVFGASETTGRFWKMAIDGSTDGGATFAVPIYAQPQAYNHEGAGLIRHFTFSNPTALTINRVRVQLQRTAVPASASMTYDPTETTIVITEISPSS
jgi:hypothetical protein